MKRFQRYEIIKTDLVKTGHLFTVDVPNLGRHEMRYLAVRGGVAWATNESPCFWCVIGQVWVDPNIYAIEEPVFELLAECSDNGLDIDTRYGGLLDDATVYKCHYYADLSGDFETEFEAYRDFLSRGSYNHGALLSAPYADRFRLGIELIKSLIKARRLEIPKETVTFEQLSRITEYDLADPACRQRFYAIEGLRHVMASFKRDPAIVMESPSFQGSLTNLDRGWML